MAEEQFQELMMKEASELKAIFIFENGLLATFNSITINHCAFENNFEISISQNAAREIQVKVDTPTQAQYLWTVLYEVVRLSMLFDGEFLQLESAEFSCNDTVADWSEILVCEYRRRIVSFYSSADYIRGTSKFACAQQFLSDELLKKWIQFEDELQLIQPMVLYGMSSVPLPVELKAAILIEAFESLFELIKKNNPEFEMAAALQKSNGGKDSKLRRMLESIILKFGSDIFAREIEKDVHSFCQVLTNSRNRIFHIKTWANKLFLGSREAILYAAKLSLLYRKVLLDLLGVDYSLYSENLKGIVSRWDTWNGTLSFFLATNWTD